MHARAVRRPGWTARTGSGVASDGPARAGGISYASAGGGTPVERAERVPSRAAARRRANGGWSVGWTRVPAPKGRAACSTAKRGAPAALPGTTRGSVPGRCACPASAGRPPCRKPSSSVRCTSSARPPPCRSTGECRCPAFPPSPPRAPSPAQASASAASRAANVERRERFNRIQGTRRQAAMPPRTREPRRGSRRRTRSYAIASPSAPPARARSGNASSKTSPVQATPPPSCHPVGGAFVWQAGRVHPTARQTNERIRRWKIARSAYTQPVHGPPRRTGPVHAVEGLFARASRERALPAVPGAASAARA